MENLSSEPATHYWSLDLPIVCFSASAQLFFKMAKETESTIALSDYFKKLPQHFGQIVPIDISFCDQSYPLVNTTSKITQAR